MSSISNSSIGTPYANYQQTNTNENEILKNLIDELPSADREKFAKSFSYIMKETFASDKGSLLQYITEIPANDRASIVQLASSLITEQMGSLMCRKILECIAAIPIMERETTVQLAVSLITEKTDEGARMGILRCIAAIPATQREACAHFASSLATEPSEKRMLLTCIKAIPIAEKEKFSQYVFSLVKKEMSEEEKRKIAYQVFKLSSSARKMHVSSLINQSTHN